MEVKHREAGSLPAAMSSADVGVESAASEPASSRRRAGGQKRKAGALSTGTTSSTPSKRITREKNSISHTPIYNHNGPLTRARQGPSTLSASAVETALAGGKLEAARDDAKVVEELNKESEQWQALEAKIEADFEAIRSRDISVHVVPTHCGWFSWTRIHPLEEQGLPSFFNGKSQDQTPDIYMEIRNWIMKKYHANPNTQIELKDLSALEVGRVDDRQDVMEFLDYWGLINFHPFPPKLTAANADGDRLANADCDMSASADDEGAAKKDSLLEELYHFDEIQLCPRAAPKPKIISPTAPSRLFPESAIAEELVKPEGPSVEYHCNYCSADCSRKRYHCQKQADFDLCTDCFNDGKFGSGMSSTDFILMVPAEAAGLSGEKWTDQETLLLLEALELYKENWNEIAEHVATKTKAQCILHFVQMPIEDVFFDHDDSVDANSKETADPVATNDDASAPKDVPETSESKTGGNEGQTQIFPSETSKSEDANTVKTCQETSRTEDVNKVKVGEEMVKSEDTSGVKVQETDENIALKALREAFEAVGYHPPESPHSFAEVGNPVMTLAAFLSLLVGPGVATASTRSSLKSISGNSPAMQLAARHCFVLEDPPGDKEPTQSESVVAKIANQDTQNNNNLEDRKHKEDNTTTMLDERDDNDSKLTEESVVEEQRTSTSSNDKPTEDLNAVKAPGNKELPKENQPNIVEKSNNLSSKFALSSVKESGEGNSSIEAAKDVELSSDALPSEKSEAGQPVISSFKAEPSQTTEAPKDVDMVSNPLESNEPQQTDSVIVNGTTTGEDQTKDSKEEKQDHREVKDEHNIDKIGQAAVTALSAAAVKAKLLANQEEDHIQQLATSLIEKQLQKLEAKLAFFNEMDNVTLRVREQMERSRQRLYHERAQIIAARLSSSRPMPTLIPANRMPPNFANSAARPPMSMTSPRPPMSRPMGTVGATPSNSFVSTAPAGRAIRPLNQDKLSSVGMK
ncbi:SWI/SNF complex subunit SWI3D-like isoform X2 [Mangifera indica]|uniref:SWI/SNF complex subunit SWI3D-like isoform X2 n=1 Tax=Mangifera indica TaxID=29780 RepID=UPI001CFA3D87|nr:SWI/SNF complex subunit SWI3D-like isoform X2 [Mangifera indica]